MANLVVDTNSLIQIIPPKSPYRPIYESVINGTNKLCVTTEILEEYEEVLYRLTRPQTASTIVRAITENPNTIYITTYFQFHLISADPDDNKFVDCAIAANAKCIVTDDHHYDVLARIPFPHVDVIGLDAFLGLLGTE